VLAPAHGEISIRDAIRLAHEGDAGCRRVIADAGAAIGSAAANLCNLLNLGRIVVGGDLASAGELLFTPLTAALERAAIPSAATDVEVVAGVLGERAEVLGAIALVLRESGMRAPAQAVA
jgi:predicted NBD/HSP70 family sugar kinase